MYSLAIPHKVKQNHQRTQQIPLSGTHPGEFKSGTQTDTCMPEFTAAFFTIAKRWKRSKCQSTDGWIKCTVYVWTVEYYLATKRNEVWTHATIWMNLKNIRLSERSQT